MQIAVFFCSHSNSSARKVLKDLHYLSDCDSCTANDLHELVSVDPLWLCDVVLRCSVALLMVCELI